MSIALARISDAKKLLLADISLLFVACVWGASYAVAKEALIFVPVLSLIFFRFAITLIVLLPLTYKELAEAAIADILRGALLGVILSMIFVAETFGVFYTTATNAAFLISLCIIITPVLDSLLEGRRPPTTILLCALCSCFGTGLMVYRSSFELNPGDFLILGAAILRAVMVISTNRLLKDRPLTSTSLSTVQFVVVAVITGGTALFLHGPEGLSLPSDQAFWTALLFLAGFCTLGAFYIQNAAVRFTNPTRVSFLMGTEPIFGALFAVLLLSEEITLETGTGAAIILISTYLGTRYAASIRAS
ncbi:MAG: DMT family transporter [Magnetovibrionaceae bacterium]